jgi:hypothetical protein
MMRGWRLLAAGCGEEFGDVTVESISETPVGEVEQAASRLTWPVIRQGAQAARDRRARRLPRT